MGFASDVRSKKGGVWIKAGYSSALLKDIQKHKKKGEKIPETLSRLISKALSQLNRTNR